uniref:Uncharacterized protein n=1 Tax=Panagrolaimus sp. ES5 TaxID=591445 RepID=A0AC34EZC3_9BILA
MSLFCVERVDEQIIDDRGTDKNVVFTFPFISNFPIQHHLINNCFATSYKMATTYWNVNIRTGFTSIVVKNAADEKWDGICFISYTLYYDDEMRFEFFSSSKIQMTESLDKFGFQTPDGYMSKFVEGLNNKKFSKCVIFIELHLPAKYFYQPWFKRERFFENEIDISYQIPDDYENDYRFQFMKTGDYAFECLDGTVLAYRVILFSSSSTMRKQLLSPFHYPVGTVLYTVDVIKPIINYFHSLCFKLPESFTFEYANRLFHAINFFEPIRKNSMLKKVQETLCQKFAAARNADNQLYHQLFGEMNVDDIFEIIDYIFKKSFFTNIILQ